MSRSPTESPPNIVRFRPKKCHLKCIWLVQKTRGGYSHIKTYGDAQFNGLLFHMGTINSILRQTHKTGTFFLPKWPLKMGMGFEAWAVHPRLNQFWVTPPPHLGGGGNLKVFVSICQLAVWQGDDELLWTLVNKLNKSKVFSMTVLIKTSVTQ